MKILILGGTNFVGRLAAEEAVARGHQVTVFNRGKSSTTPDGATAIVGDRLKPDGYKNLEGLYFDSVIDTWTYNSSVVASGVDALKGRTAHYVYISTAAVYDTVDTTRPVVEDNKLVDTGDSAPSSYLKDKVLGEYEALKSGVPTLLPRPSIILGPHENTPGRLPWWLRRLERGGPTLAPGPPENVLQFVDGRDLANFTIDGIESRLEGAYNISGELNEPTWKGFLDEANAVAGDKARLLWLEPEKLEESGIKGWSELPMYVPPNKITDFYAIGTEKARKAGLRTRPAAETIADSWVWLKSSDVPQAPPGIGLDPKKESAILKKYFQVSDG